MEKKVCNSRFKCDFCETLIIERRKPAKIFGFESINKFCIKFYAYWSMYHWDRKFIFIWTMLHKFSKQLQSNMKLYFYPNHLSFLLRWIISWFEAWRCPPTYTLIYKRVFYSNYFWLIIIECSYAKRNLALYKC